MPERFDKLLLELFTANELIRWLTVIDPTLPSAVDGNKALADLAFETQETLRRRGLLTQGTIWRSLLQERPGRSKDIREAAALVLSESEYRRLESDLAGLALDAHEPDRGYDVFISGSVDDVTASEDLACRLRDSGMRVFFERWTSLRSSPTEAIAGSRCLLVLVGPDGIGAKQEAHAVAARTGLRAPAAPVEPLVLLVLLPGAPDVDQNRLPSLLRWSSWFDLRRGVDDQQGLERLRALIWQTIEVGSSEAGLETTSARRDDEPRLRWLHLADLELPQGRSEHEALIASFTRGGSLSERRPDLIFVTGDVVSSGTEDAFSEATAFIHDITSATGVSPGRVFMVPGDRDRKYSRLIRIDLPDSAAADEFFSASDMLEMALGRFAAFSAFQSKVVGQRMTLERPFVAERLRLHGTDLRIIGLNSAWADGSSDGGWVLGTQVVRTALQQGRRRSSYCRAVAPRTGRDRRLRAKRGEKPHQWAGRSALLRESRRVDGR